jgi:hypothetical protein
MAKNPEPTDAELERLTLAQCFDETEASPAKTLAAFTLHHPEHAQRLTVAQVDKAAKKWRKHGFWTEFRTRLQPHSTRRQIRHPQNGDGQVSP